MAIAIYVRKSVERENSISCATQEEYCKAMIRPDERGEKTVTYVDNGYSGGNTNRGGFQKMMRAVQRGKISKVIVYRLDRISRSLADFVNILATFKEYNVKFVSSQESFDTASPYGEMIIKILMVFAEFERQSIIDRVTQAYEHRSEMGFYMGGRRPYGFNLESTTINNIPTKRLILDPVEAEQIRYIYENYAIDNVTLNKLLKKLVANGMLPSEGKGWTTAKLSTIIKNPIYVRADNRVYEYFQKYNTHIVSPPESFDGVHGVQLYGRSKHKAGDSDWSDITAVVMTHEGLIDSDIWIKCQRKIVRNKQIRNAVSNKTSWLGGKIVCGKCGCTMTTIKGKVNNCERRYFNCTGRSHHKTCSGVRATIYADSLEDMVYGEIAKKLSSLKCEIRPKSSGPLRNELLNKLKSIELEEARLIETMTHSEVNSDLLTLLSKKASSLKEAKTELMIRLDDLNNQEISRKSAVNLSKRWKNATFEEKRGVCNILIERIIIDNDGNAEIFWKI